ncbi:MAG: prepilin-type N-terminal cleavage/methylation domain-containing protein [Planctomycetota bacterium]
MSRHAFTLIELLVVLTIASLLVSLVLPVLGASREAARDLSCKANLQQMNIGWSAVLADTRHRIPETHSASVPPGNPAADPVFQRWDLLLFDRMNTPIVPGQRPRIVCPASRDAFGSIDNTSGHTTYGVSVRWDLGSAPGDNERKSWDMLLSPSTYPFFADTDALRIGDLEIIRDEFGLRTSPYTSPTWQLGFFHPEATTNIAWGDGHVSSRRTDVIDPPASVNANGVPLFFFNQPGARLAAAWPRATNLP